MTTDVGCYLIPHTSTSSLRAEVGSLAAPPGERSAAVAAASAVSSSAQAVRSAATRPASSCRILGSEIEAPNPFVNLVRRG